MKPDQGIIAIEGMRFHAYHGYYKKERESGNRFEVDVYIKADLSEAAATDNLDDTVNYEIIYKIVKEVMDKKHKLLEHVCQITLETLAREMPPVEEIRVRVSKFEPPIEGDIQRVYVELGKTFDQSHRK